MDPRDPRTALAVRDFLQAVLDRHAGRVAVVKPQAALFEQLGWRGLHVLEQVVEYARRLDMLVILDAKRGDIDSTAAAYARYLDPNGALPVDAITLNPWLGLDSLEPFVSMARQHGSGLFILVKTSNPGAADFQDLRIGGHPLFEQVARALAPTEERLRGEETGWSSLGVVVGATQPQDAPRVREILPRALFLVPGYGAQGGGAAAAVRGFVPGPDGALEGGIVNSSRGLLFPPGSTTTEAKSWEATIDAARDRAIEELTMAVRG